MTGCGKDRPLFNPLNAELNPICHLLALLGAHHILHVSGVRVKEIMSFCSVKKIVSMMGTWEISTKLVHGVGYAKGVSCLNEGRIIGWRNKGLIIAKKKNNIGRCRRFFFPSPKHPERLRGPRCLFFECWGSFPGVNRPGREVSHSPTTSTAVPQLLYISNVYWTVHHCNSWWMKDQLDVTCYFILLIMCSTCFGH